MRHQNGGRAFLPARPAEQKAMAPDVLTFARFMDAWIELWQQLPELFKLCAVLLGFIAGGHRLAADHGCQVFGCFFSGMRSAGGVKRRVRTNMTPSSNSSAANSMISHHIKASLPFQITASLFYTGCALRRRPIQNPPAPAHRQNRPGWVRRETAPP